MNDKGIDHEIQKYNDVYLWRLDIVEPIWHDSYAIHWDLLGDF